MTSPEPLNGGVWAMRHKRLVMHLAVQRRIDDAERRVAERQRSGGAAIALGALFWLLIFALALAA